MKPETPAPIDNAANILLAQECLMMISNMAARGARSLDPERIGYILQELSQVIGERNGSKDIVFELMPPQRIPDLPHLHAALSFMHGISQDEMWAAVCGTPVV